MSISYGQDEATATTAYANRQCTEYAKVRYFHALFCSHSQILQLGMMGTSVIYSSGDSGVAGNNNTCLDSNRMSWMPPQVPLS